MGFDGTLFDLGHRQVGSLSEPMIAWPLQPSGSMPPKRVIHKLLKGNTSTSQMCDQLAASVDSVIFFTLLAMNVVQ